MDWPRVSLIGLCCVLAALPAHGAEPAADDRRLAIRIDRLLAERWTEMKVQPSARSEDAEFLRRVYLDLTGRIPPVAEVRRFLNDKAVDKRRALVERLLDGPGYVTHFAGIWRLLLAPDAEANPGREAAVAALDRWLHKQFADEVGFDRMVRTLLTLSPDEIRRGQGMNGDGPSPRMFFLGREDKPEELAAATTRLFLGVRLECAQCHNHPHTKWTRDHFWTQAAFFTNIRGSGMNGLTIPGTDRKAMTRFLDGTATPEGKIESRLVLAGWITSVFASPMLARWLMNSAASMNFSPALAPPLTPKFNRPDAPFGRYFFASA